MAVWGKVKEAKAQAEGEVVAQGPGKARCEGSEFAEPAGTEGEVVTPRAGNKPALGTRGAVGASGGWAKGKECGASAEVLAGKEPEETEGCVWPVGTVRGELRRGEDKGTGNS